MVSILFFYCVTVKTTNSVIEVSTSLSNVGGLAVGAFDLINHSLSVVRFVSVFNVGQ